MIISPPTYPLLGLPRVMHIKPIEHLPHLEDLLGMDGDVTGLTLQQESKSHNNKHCQVYANHGLVIRLPSQQRPNPLQILPAPHRWAGGA